MTERTIIIDAVIKVIMLLVTAILIPSIKSWIDRNRDNKEIQLVLQMASIAVKSVENDLKTAEGQVKKQEAFRRLVTQIQSWGIKDFTLDELDHYIETAVKEMWQDEYPIYEDPDPEIVYDPDLPPPV